jgi:hypothetical protein
MIRGIEYSKPLAAAGFTALVAAGAMFWMRTAASRMLSEQRRHAAVAESELETRIGAMSKFESENVEALRLQVKRVRLHLAADGTWGRLVGRLGSGWVADGASMEDRNGYSIQSGAFRLRSHAVGEWPEIVEAVKDLEAMPGVGVAELEFRATGNGVHRSLDTARIVVVVQAIQAGSNTESTP